MGDGDTPQIDRAVEPEFEGPPVETRPPPPLEPSPTPSPQPTSSVSTSPAGTHNLIAELRNSMAVIARSGQSRNIRIRSHGRYGLTRLMLSLFLLLGYVILLGGLAFAAVAAMEWVTGAPAPFGLGGMGGVFAAKLMLGLGAVWAGFFTISVSQSSRAQIDGADYARQALVLSKAIAEGTVEIDTRRRSDKPALETEL